jgi:WD40 repeat protein
VHGIDFTSGGRFLAAAYGDGADVWNLESRERVATIPAARDLTAAAFSPDGTLIAIRGEGIAEVWSWKPLRRLRSVQLHGHVRWAWLSADNRLLVTRDAEQSSVWNVPSGARLPLPQDFRLPVLSPNAKTLVTLTDVPARLWDTRSSRSIAKLRAHGKPTSAAFAPDGSRLAIGTRSGWVALFDASGNRIKLLRPQVESGSAKHPAIAAVAFSPDGRLLAAAAGTWGHVWDVQRLREVEAVPTVSSLFALAFSPNSKLLATQGTDGALRLWDMVGDHLVAQLAQVGLRAATTGFDARGHVLIGGTDGSVRSYSPSTGRPVAKTPAPVRASRVAALGLDGGLAMLVASHGRVRIEYIPGRRIVRTLRVTGTVTKSAFSRDGRMLATAAADGSVRLWGAWSDVLDRVLRLRGPTVTGLSFSDNGALAISDRTGRVVVLDLRAGGARRVVRRSGGSVTAVAFGSDGTLAAALSDHEVLIWRSPGSKKSIELTGTGPVRSVSFSRDGSLLLTTGEEAVGVWGLETKKMLLELPGPAVSAVFDSTGERIVTRDKRGRARLYECTPCGSSTQLANLAQR